MGAPTQQARVVAMCWFRQAIAAAGAREGSGEALGRDIKR